MADTGSGNSVSGGLDMGRERLQSKNQYSYLGEDSQTRPLEDLGNRLMDVFNQANAQSNLLFGGRGYGGSFPGSKSGGGPPTPPPSGGGGPTPHPVANPNPNPTPVTPRPNPPTPVGNPWGGPVTPGPGIGTPVGQGPTPPAQNPIPLDPHTLGPEDFPPIATPAPTQPPVRQNPRLAGPQSQTPPLPYAAMATSKTVAGQQPTTWGADPGGTNVPTVDLGSLWGENQYAGLPYSNPAGYGGPGPSGAPVVAPSQTPQLPYAPMAVSQSATDASGEATASQPIEVPLDDSQAQSAFHPVATPGPRGPYEEQPGSQGPPGVTPTPRPSPAPPNPVSPPSPPPAGPPPSGGYQQPFAQSLDPYYGQWNPETGEYDYTSNFKNDRGTQTRSYNPSDPTYKYFAEQRGNTYYPLNPANRNTEDTARTSPVTPQGSNYNDAWSSPTPWRPDAPEGGLYGGFSDLTAAGPQGIGETVQGGVARGIAQGAIGGMGDENVKALLGSYGNMLTSPGYSATAKAAIGQEGMLGARGASNANAAQIMAMARRTNNPMATYGALSDVSRGESNALGGQARRNAIDFENEAIRQQQLARQGIGQELGNAYSRQAGGVGLLGGANQQELARRLQGYSGLNDLYKNQQSQANSLLSQLQSLYSTRREDNTQLGKTTGQGGVSA